jgi:hypothetical protein
MSVKTEEAQIHAVILANAELPGFQPGACRSCGQSEDAHLAVELGDDPYIPLIGSLPGRPTAEQALEWIRRQRGRLAEGTGPSFAIDDAGSGNAAGAIGLWLQNLPAGRATAGYPVSAAHRAAASRAAR